MEKKPWEGIAPDPQVFYQLDFEQITVLAHIAWCSAARRPILLPDLVNLPGDNGDEPPRPLGHDNVIDIIESLVAMNVCSVRNHYKREARSGDLPLSVFVGGFQKRFPPITGNGSSFTPRVPATQAPPAQRNFREEPRKEKPPQQRYYPPQVDPDDRVLIETGVYARKSKTPAYIIDGFSELKKEIVATETSTELGPVEKVEAMYQLAQKKVVLYKRWLKTNPNNKKIADILDKKKRIAEEIKTQLDNVRRREASAS